MYSYIITNYSVTIIISTHHTMITLKYIKPIHKQMTLTIWCTYKTVIQEDTQKYYKKHTLRIKYAGLL
jgi:hypothetical protein